MTTKDVSQVRIVARIRPILSGENERDVVVTVSSEGDKKVVTMPNPKNENEIFSFPFNTVYGDEADQAQIFSEGERAVLHTEWQATDG